MANDGSADADAHYPPYPRPNAHANGSAHATTANAAPDAGPDSPV